VPRAVVFLVAPGSFVLLDGAGFVLVDRKAARHSRLFVRAHPQPVQVQRRNLVEQERSPLAQRREVLPRPLVHARGVGIGIRWEINLGPRHTQKAQGIIGGQLPRLFRADDVVRDG
jgi:hypothetical protein